ncbi:MAG: DCC1-like thiol-disulfide oxidoreductase family protein [Ginsengibacter sp.]
MPDGLIILYDGVCNFCNSAVDFVIKRDERSVFKFAPLQSKVAKKILSDNNLSDTDFSSFIFIDKNNIYSRSTAALKVCRYLDGWWPLMYGFIIVPKMLRDGVYNWVAKNRYRWFGKKSCVLPNAEVRSRFLNDI